MITASEIVAKFGGTTRLAAKLSRLSEKVGTFPPAGVSTVSMWRSRGRIAGGYHAPLLMLAREEGIELSPEDLLSTTNRGEAA